MQQQTPSEEFDLASMVADLNNLLRLKTTVIGMKMFARVDEMAAPLDRKLADLAAEAMGSHSRRESKHAGTAVFAQLIAY